MLFRSEKPISMDYLDKNLMARILEIRAENPDHDGELQQMNDLREKFNPNRPKYPPQEEPQTKTEASE